MAVTCEVEAPSAMAFWKRCGAAATWPAAGRCNHGNNAELLPELGDGAQNGDFGDFAAQRMLQLGRWWHRPLRAACRPARPAAKPGASRSVADCGASRGRRAAHRRRAEPRRRQQSRLLARLTQQIRRTATPSVSRRTSRSSASAINLGSGVAIPLTRYGLNKGWRDEGGKLPSWAGRDTIPSLPSRYGRPQE